jgi:hypothetical protein
MGLEGRVARFRFGIDRCLTRILQPGSGLLVV